MRIEWIKQALYKNKTKSFPKGISGGALAPASKKKFRLFFYEKEVGNFLFLYPYELELFAILA